MKPKWQKLASLAQEICALWFQFFGASLLPKDTLLRTYNIHIVIHLATEHFNLASIMSVLFHIIICPNYR